MKRFLTSLAIVLMLSTLAIGQSKFDNGVVDTTKIGDFKSPSKTGPLIEGGGKLTDVVGLEIKQVYARRNAAAAHTIVVRGVLQNTFTREIKASWTLMKWDDSSWVNVRKESDVLVPPNGTKDVTIRLPATNDAMRLRWVVSWTKPSTRQVAKEFRLPARAITPPEPPKTVFVVTYRTGEGRWVKVMDYREANNPNRLIGQAAREESQKLMSLGLRTQIHLEKPLFKSNRIILYFTEKDLTRTFDTREQAEAFRSELRSHTVDIADGRRAAGLTITIDEKPE